MAKLTLSDLKKQLVNKTKEELIQEIATLYQRIPAVKEYYQVRGDDVKDVVKKYKDIIKKEFTEGRGRAFPKGRLSVGKKAVSDFKRLTDDPEPIADVMLTYAECLSAFNDAYSVRDEDYYTSAEDMFENALELIRETNLLAKFKARAHKIVKNATDGFGHCDTLQDAYEEVYGEFK